MSDWRAELERERHTVPSTPAADACNNGPTAAFWREKRACSKRRFLSETVARNFAWLLEIRYPDGVRRDVYECDMCEPGIWHVTRWQQDDTEHAG